MTKNPAEILEQALVRASANLSKPLVKDKIARERSEYVCRCLSNRAGVRLLMACLKDNRMATLLAGLRHSEDAMPLSSEAIVTLVAQHLACKNSGRLPVLIVAAAYQAAGDKIGERLLPLERHNAADEQTGAMGDLEICLVNDDQVVTAYEMKMKRVTINDIDRALQKIATAPTPIHNYIFITTDVVDDPVKTHAAEAYERTGGTEIAILDCIGFLRHFLHLFHRLRIST